MLPAIFALGKLGKLAWEKLVPEETKLALRSDAIDVGVSLGSGKRSVEEWAETFIPAIDEVKERAIRENDVNYVGGKLKFSIEKNNEFRVEVEKVTVSFELYFQDSDKQWGKCADSSKMSQVFFTPESLAAIAKDGVEFDIT